jgi:hypothetical protein
VDERDSLDVERGERRSTMRHFFVTEIASQSLQADSGRHLQNKSARKGLYNRNAARRMAFVFHPQDRGYGYGWVLVVLWAHACCSDPVVVERCCAEAVQMRPRYRPASQFR